MTKKYTIILANNVSLTERNDILFKLSKSYLDRFETNETRQQEQIIPTTEVNQISPIRRSETSYPNLSRSNL